MRGSWSSRTESWAALHPVQPTLALHRGHGGPPAPGGVSMRLPRAANGGRTWKYLPLPHPTSATTSPAANCCRNARTLGHTANLPPPARTLRLCVFCMCILAPRLPTHVVRRTGEPNLRRLFATSGVKAHGGEVGGHLVALKCGAMVLYTSFTKRSSSCWHRTSALPSCPAGAEACSPCSCCSAV